MESLEIPFLREVHDAGTRIELPSGAVDIGQLHLQLGAVLHSVVNDLAEPGNPERKIISARQEVQKIDFQIEIAVTGSNLRNVQAVMPGAGVRDKRAHFRQKPEAKAGIWNRFLGVIVKAQADAVAAARDQLRLAVHGQKGNARVANVAVSVPGFHGAQVGSTLLRFGKGRQI